MKSSCWWIFSLCIVLASSAVAAPPPHLDATVARVLATFQTPGVAVTIVENDRVSVAKGWGVRSLEERAPVTADTLFRIASCTKPFTATLIGQLVDDGKLSWDDRVAAVVPDFGLSEAYASHEVRLRDLLAHRSGLGVGAGDLLFAPPTIYTRFQILRRLQQVPLAHGFRERFAYNNLGFVAAGSAVAAALDSSWENAMRTRILEPLGMSATVTTTSEFTQAANRVAAHVRDESAGANGALRVVPTPQLDPVAPIGGMASSANDMARWVSALLNGGEFKGARIISTKNLEQTWTLNTPIPIAAPSPPLAATRPNFYGYGLGWFIRDVGGRKVVLHAGDVPGGRALTLLIPSERIGFVILTNSGEGATTNALAWTFLEHYLKLPHQDWIEAHRRAVELRNARAKSETIPHESAAAVGTEEMQALVGTYDDSWYGTVTLRSERDALTISFDATPSMRGALEPIRPGLWRTRWLDRTIADAYVHVLRRTDGSVQQLQLEPLSPTADFSFDYADLSLIRRPE
jgi:CubicO group peptidase (beta-lactamase class C family)